MDNRILITTGGPLVAFPSDTIVDVMREQFSEAEKFSDEALHAIYAYEIQLWAATGEAPHEIDNDTFLSYAEYDENDLISDFGYLLEGHGSNSADVIAEYLHAGNVSGVFTCITLSGGLFVVGI